MTETGPSTAGDQTRFFIDLAAQDSGRPADEITREFERLNSGRGRITAEEYVKFALHDSRKFSPEDKDAFISDKLFWPVLRRCCDITWEAATEDKWLADRILTASGLPVPEILAVIDQGQRIYPRTRMIRSLDAFRAFLKDWRGQPFFAKPVVGLASRGILRGEHYDDRHVFVTGRGNIEIEQLYLKALSQQPYLVQPVQKNHEFFDGMCVSLATVRIGTLVFDDAVRLAFCFLKMPGPSTLEDRFHPVGNIACNLRPDTGEIISIRRRTKHGATSHQVHPDNGMALIGRRVPWWPALRQLVAVTARTFAPVRYQSMDIAVTPTGPVIIEVNSGGGFGGPQMVMERGMLQTDFLPFLEACGIDLAKLKPTG